MPVLMLAFASWVLLAVLLLAGGPAVHGEGAPASTLLETAGASTTTTPITTTEGITETPPLPEIVVTSTFTPTETPTATPTQPSPTPVPTALPTLTPSPPASPEPASTEQTRTSPKIRPHYVRGDSNVTFQWGMLVDSLALGISWAWLVVGIIIGVGLPILFVVLWVRSKRRRSAQGRTTAKPFS